MLTINMIRLKVPLHQRVVLTKLAQKYFIKASYYTASVAIDAFENIANESYKRQRNGLRNNLFVNDLSLRCMKFDSSDQKKDLSDMSPEELDNFVLELLQKKRDKQLTELFEYCYENRISISDSTLKRMFRSASLSGKVDTVLLLQKYTMRIDPYLHKRNGEFLHYVAKAQCMRGNSEKGLSILMQCYSKYEVLRSFYRIILRELIQDSVLNRSEACLVIFKKYMLEFSKIYNDHYPLVCFWHVCWTSSWFSDQQLADDLLETSEDLRDIVKDKATAFSITVLREYNDDAVTRLLQSLLKYKMMDEYVKVLQVLFSYKLRNRDLHGCTEILRNCEALGLSLPSDQQGKYIKMLINTKSEKPPTKPNLKFKF